MVISHQKFDLAGKSLIEKLVILAPFRFVANFQNEGCFIHFVEGNPKIISAFESVQLKSAESVLLKCGNYIADLLRSATSDSFEIVVIHLHPDILKKIYRDTIPKFLSSDQKVAITKVDSGIAIQKFIENIYFYFENPGLVDDDLLELKIKELILLLAKSDAPDSLTTLFSNLFTPREVILRDLIHSHVFSPLAVKDLASLASMSLSTFNRAFHAIFNETPATYLRTKRLERARELLMVSSKSVSEIAYETGFNDLPHFSRTFKDKFDLAPSEYRIAFKNKM